MYLRLILWGTRNLLLQAQFIENTFVKCTLLCPAHVKCLIVILQALPMSLEILQAVLPYFPDDFSRTARNFPSFFQAMFRTSIFGFTEHEILIKRLAICPNEE